MIWALIGAAIVADGAAALVGGLLPEGVLRRHRPLLMGIAVGMLVGTTGLDLLPAAFNQTPASVVLALVAASAAVMAVVEWGAGWLHSRRRGNDRIAWMLLTADALHNATDGAAVAAAFLLSVRLGVATALAVVAHELPEELADYVVLRGAALNRRRALVAMTLIQFTAAVGALLVIVFARVWSRVSGLMLAVGAGTFIYIAVVDLAPALFGGGAADPQNRRRAWTGAAIGLIAAALQLAF